MALHKAEAAENREDWVKVAKYTAHVINGLANSYDKVRFNEDMKRLRELIEAAKKRAGQSRTGTPVT